ncbi:hypothetical protein ACF0H5_011313 [Mactra antiquata]
MDVSDFESVQMKSSSLSNEAARHRISVKPKSRRLSSKVSMRKRDRSPVPPQLPDVKEESPSKTLLTSEPSSSMPHKTVISTTIAVGPPADSGANVIPRSEPRPIPSKPEVKEMAKSEPRDIVVTRREGDIDRTRPRSLSPLSTSPVSQSMIQEVKLRPRPASGKFDGVDLKKDSPEKPDNELAKAFNRAKRISKKFDEDGNVIDTNIKPVVKAPQKEPEKTIDMSKSMDLSRSIDMTKSMDMSKSVTLPKGETKTVSSSTPAKDTSSSPTVSSPVSGGVSFVLKKEPLRPGNKPEGTLVRTGSVEAKETPKVTPAVDPKPVVSETPKSTANVNNDQKKDVNSPSKTVKLGSPEKLASPREEYRLKRAARSKTLPVSSEMIEKAEEAEKSSSNSRLGSPPLRSRTRNDYDNVSIESKASSIQSKRSSWASSSITTNSTSSEPAWVVRARLKQMEQENKEKEKSDATKEVKIDVKSSNNNSVAKSDKTETDNVNKANDKTSIEQKTDISKGIVQTGSVKSWAQNYSAKPFEKPTSTVTAKPSAGISSVGSKTSFDKTSVQSVKPVTVTTSDQSSLNKPVVTTSKPTTSLGSKPTFSPASKPTVSSVSKPTVSNFSKPTVSAATKPPLASTTSNVDKPTTFQSSKPSGLVSSSNSEKTHPQSGKVPGFGGVSSTSGFSRSFSQKTGSTPVQKASVDNKPVQSVTNKSINVQKPDSKDNVSKPASISSISKDTKNSDNDNKSSNTGSTSTKSGSSFDKSKTSFGNTKPDTSSSVPAWKQALNQKKAGSSQVKIEIIDKDSDTKPAQKKIDELRNKFRH